MEPDTTPMEGPGHKHLSVRFTCSCQEKIVILCSKGTN